MQQQTTLPTATLGLAACLALVAVLGPAGIDMYLASMPAMAHELHTAYANVQLSLTVFLLALGGGQLLCGPLTDMLGRRYPLLAGIAVYIVAAVWGSQADQLSTLLLARTLQGLGAALTLVVVMSMVRDVADGVQAAQLFALLMTIVGLAPVLAPAVGGLLDAHYGWRAVMLALAALGGLTLLNSVLFLPETLPRARRISPRGLHRTYARIALQRAFLLPALALAASFFFLFAYIGGAALVYQRDFGLSAGSFGLVFGATGVAVLLGAMASARLVEKYAVARLCVAGSSAMLGGAVLALLGVWAGFGIVAVVPGMFMALFGLGIAEAALMAMAMGSQHKALGSTAALLGAIQMSLSSLATPLAASLSESGPLPWLLFLTVAGLLVSWLTLATARVHPARTTSLGAH
ncbi:MULTISPECIES: Bcr/CflA family efflux MFS transporter [unclassified Janthinobacterium]|uniref:Bcr/CflA family efflux MFS transporter n=1 Tax=unclassified Janthinobacterium TaxID=2610881 RepID=UPI0018CB913F|nr:Bcr/CflA family efflux MFS transporter [Janthinobacterium sp. CG_23.4]MDH6157748.1 DHA1 family bicyclomycin/chloramphenicol resistance-like MFS transporter [Janthinobacterium sp. CG_23.4]